MSSKMFHLCQAQLKKRSDSDHLTDGPGPSPSVSRSPNPSFLPRAARVLPPTGTKENRYAAPACCLCLQNVSAYCLPLQLTSCLLLWFDLLQRGGLTAVVEGAKIQETLESI